MQLKIKLDQQKYEICLSNEIFFYSEYFQMISTFSVLCLMFRTHCVVRLQTDSSYYFIRGSCSEIFFIRLIIKTIFE